MIAQTADGKYVKFNAAKGVILCAAILSAMPRCAGRS
jgi:hypothetical protein